jgi:hypothetical protein
MIGNYADGAMPNSSQCLLAACSTANEILRQGAILMCSSATALHAPAQGACSRIGGRVQLSAD